MMLKKDLTIPFVRLVSTIALVALLCVDAVMIFFALCGFPACFDELIDPTQGTLDGAETPLLNALAQFFAGLGVFLLGLVIVIGIAEISAKIFFTYKAVKEHSDGFYALFSMVSIIEVIANTIVVFFEALIDISHTVIDSDTVSILWGAALLINLFVLMWLIPDLILANKLAKSESFRAAGKKKTDRTS